MGDFCELEALEDEPVQKTNFCEQVPDLCENGATCLSDNIGGYRCNCPPGFLGRRCQIVPCDYRPCPERSVCKNLENGKTDKNSYKCECPKGKKGENCTENDDLCRCQNNGNYYIVLAQFFGILGVDDFFKSIFLENFYFQEDLGESF